MTPGDLNSPLPLSSSGTAGYEAWFWDEDFPDRRTKVQDNPMDIIFGQRSDYLYPDIHHRVPFSHAHSRVIGCQTVDRKSTLQLRQA